MPSILASTKEALGIPAAETVFDAQLMILINMTLGTLAQLISGPEIPYQIEARDFGDIEDCIPNDVATQNLVQAYISTKVRVLFDPPSNSVTLQAFQTAITEYEWRLNGYVIQS
jgi:hypothetical protein